MQSSANVAQNEARQWAQKYLNNRLNTKTDAPSRPFTVPVIDISSTFSGSLQNKQAVASQIRDACTNSGYPSHSLSQHPHTPLSS